MARRAPATARGKGDVTQVILPDSPNLMSLREVPDLMTVAEVSAFLRVRQAHFV